MATRQRRNQSSKSAVSFRKPFKVSVERLRFDLRNPRYASDPLSGRSSDAQIISQLMVSADVAELVQSIAANGYIDIEPMIVMPEGQNFLVLEGNRRLAAIRLLRNEELARECSFVPPHITDAVAKTLEEVTVYAVHKRDEARDFIGFKHINGPHRWDALSKGKRCSYATRLVAVGAV